MSGQPSANPFAGMSITDPIRDVLAAVALFSALGLSWNMDNSELTKGGNHWWVVIAVLISVASLALPYLHWFRLLGPLTSSHTQLIKLGANAPAFASIIAAIIYDLVHFSDLTSGAPAGGIGGGVVMLAAGSALAVQPRSFETVPNHIALIWRMAGIALGGLALFVVAVTTIRFLAFADDLDLWDETPLAIAWILRGIGGVAIIFAIPYVLAVMGRFYGTITLSVVGGTIAVNELISTLFLIISLLLLTLSFICSSISSFLR